MSFNQRLVTQQCGITYLFHPAWGVMGLVQAAKAKYFNLLRVVLPLGGAAAPLDS